MLKYIQTALLSSSLLLVASAGLTQDKKEYGDSLVIIACRVDDWSGKRKPQGTDPDTLVFPSREWKDLEWHENEFGELECKREVLDPQGQEKVTGILPANPNYGTNSSCAHGAMMVAPAWNFKNEGWAVIGIGCPNPMYKDGKVIGYMMPGCPRELQGKAIKCHFDENEV